MVDIFTLPPLVIDSVTDSVSCLWNPVRTGSWQYEEGENILITCGFNGDFYRFILLYIFSMLNEDVFNRALQRSRKFELILMLLHFTIVSGGVRGSHYILQRANSVSIIHRTKLNKFITFQVENILMFI